MSMNIVMITENDPAGMAIAFTNAINKHTEHNCRLITTTAKYNFNFKKDLHVPDLDEDGLQEIRQLLEKADIIHFHVLADENIRLGLIRVSDFITGKSIVHHHHGHPDFRAHPQKYREKYHRLKRKVLVSTPDLLQLLPEATWQPNLVPIYDPLYLPHPRPLNGVVVIGQSVTRKEIKNTEELLITGHEINQAQSSLRLEVDIIENTDYKECLKRKNRCHIIFDHMQGYYGVSSLESLSQGKPVIAGIDAWNKRWIEDFTGSERIPWIIARNEVELKARLRDLMDAIVIEETGISARNWMEKYWNDQCVTNRLENFYFFSGS